jgi:hypothetical protein
MIQYYLIWLENKGYSNVYMIEEANFHIFFKGNDSKGSLLKFKYNKLTGRMSYRGVGNKHWKTLGRVKLN